MRKNPFPQCFQRSHFLAVLVLLIALPHSLGAQSGKFSSELGLCVPTPLDPPLERLQKGNKCFVVDNHFIGVRDKAYREDKQSPYAIILSCADSRVPPELVFGEWGSLGKLFVIRTAGNVIDPVALGSIEYGAQILKAKLVFVLGHEKCGAVEAARAQAASPQNPNIAWFLDPIKLAVERTKGKPEEETVKENVRVQIQNLRNQSSIIRELETKGLKIAGGFYNISSAKKTGVVDFF
jgi:carbonic anhydrase